MPAQRQKIYLEVMVLKLGNAVELRPAEVLAIPCKYLVCREAEKRMLLIEYVPGSELATREQIIAVQLRAYARRHEIVSYQVFNDFLTPRLT